MSAVLGTPKSSGNDVNSRLEFFKKLQTVTNKIHATSNIDEIMLDVTADICNLFHCDRVTIYLVDETGKFIVSKVKTGLNSFNDLKLPISDQSVAGYVASFKEIANIRDVYDEAELKSHSPGLHFLQEVDKRTGYRTKEMLVAPLLDAANGNLLGVTQLINNKRGGPFTAFEEEGLKELCATLAIAFTQRMKPVGAVKSKYDVLISDAVLSAGEFELAARSARRQELDIEEVLVNEFQVPLNTIGQSLGKFFGVPYTPFKPDRIKPVDLLKNLKRDYIEQNRWLPIEDAKEGLIVLTVDPELVKNSRVVTNVFARSKPVYHVTTHSEFRQTVDQFFGIVDDPTSVTDMLSGMDDGSSDEEGSEVSASDISAAAENALDQMKETSTGALKETIAAALAQHREKKKNAEPPRAPQNPTPGDF